MNPAEAAASGEVLRHPEPVMGTVVSFTVYPGRLDRSAARRALGEATRGLHHADELFSTWKDDSPLSRLRRGELSLSDAPPEIGEVLDACAAARTASGGWFDPWAMSGGVDPTGLVKGWATQRATDVLRRAGVRAAMVSAGGDIATVGCAPDQDEWLIGVTHPWQPTALAALVALPPDGAVATSGNYERPGQLVDPRSGRVASDVISATVTGPDLALADALATAVAVGGSAALDEIERLEGYEAYLITAAGHQRSSAGMGFRHPA